MQINWQTVEGTQAEKPLELDTVSSPSVVYLRKNITQETRKQENGEEVTLWIYDEARLTQAEYKEYLELSQIFYTPEMEQLKSQMEDEQLVLANISANAEYTVCLQELNM